MRSPSSRCNNVVVTRRHHRGPINFIDRRTAKAETALSAAVFLDDDAEPQSAWARALLSPDADLAANQQERSAAYRRATRRLVLWRSACLAAGVCIFLLSTSAAWAQHDKTSASDASKVVDPWTPGTGIFNEGSSPTTTVDPSTGVLHTVIPFSLLPARGAAQPSLNLVYSSDAGTRTAGVGWGLDLPAIERKPLSSPGRYFAAAASFDPKTPPWTWGTDIPSQVNRSFRSAR
jgi:hypothetical protein